MTMDSVSNSVQIKGRALKLFLTRLHLILNLVLVALFLIFTEVASFLCKYHVDYMRATVFRGVNHQQRLRTGEPCSGSP